jgi:hypothetical protein
VTFVKNEMPRCGISIIPAIEEAEIRKISGN